MGRPRSSVGSEGDGGGALELPESKNAAPDLVKVLETVPWTVPLGSLPQLPHPAGLGKPKAKRF